MPLLESLIGLTQTGRRVPVDGVASEKRPLADSSLTGGDDRWTPSGSAIVRKTGRRTSVLARDPAEEKRVCGNPQCRNAWGAFWKSHGSPIFEGKWACCRGCAAAMARTALARETGQWPEDEGPVEHRHRIPLGLVLLAHGWVTHAKLQRALEAQRANGCGRIGEWLVAECGLSAEQVARGLSAQWNCPVLTLDGFSPQTMAMALPRILIEEYGALPLRVAGGRVLYVGFQDRLDAAASFAIEQMTGLKVESGILSEAAFRRAKQRLLESRFPGVALAEEADRDALAESVAATIERTRPVGSKLIKLHRYYWLRVWSDDGCRPGGRLPAGVDGVSDYLFTIERPAMPVFKANAETAIRSAVEAAAVAEAEGDLADEPGAVRESALGKTPSTPGKPSFEADREVSPELFPEQGDDSRAIALAVVERGTVVEKENDARLVAVSRLYELKEPAATWVSERIEAKVEDRIEPMDGEYLPGGESGDEDLRDREATGFLSLHRRPGWNQIQLWTLRVPMFLRRGQHPASDPGQEG